MNGLSEDARKMFKKPGSQEDKRHDNETPEVESRTHANTLGSRSQPNNLVNPAAIRDVINGRAIMVVAYLPSKRDS
jgi:hypothetical protein